MKTISKLSFIVANGALALGCDDPLKPVELIVDTRVLGARVEVEGDSGRAAPGPGETATARVFVAAPAPDPALGWALLACTAAPGSALPSSCEGPAFASALREEPAPGAPELELVVPDSPGGPRVALVGVVCPGAAPDVDGSGCTGGGGTHFELNFELAQGERANQNPAFEAESLSFDGAVWEPGSDCAVLPRVTRGSTHTVGVDLDEGDRDALERANSTDPARESLQVSHFTTTGELDRAFTVFDSEATDLRARVEWRAPGRVPASGVARFFLVVRDLRGGSDFAERAVCIE